MDGLSEPWAGRSITWQLEYPGSPTPAGEAETVIYVVQEELQGIVPLAMVSAAPGSAVLPVFGHDTDTERQLEFDFEL